MKDKILEQILQTLLDNKGENVCYLNVSNVNPLAEYYVIVTATSSRHAMALANYVDEVLYKNNVITKHIEGNEKSEWILVDGLDYIIHIFVGDARLRYGLEKMWSNLEIIKVE